MPTFRDRADAARQLAAELEALKGRDPLILAIPRGAVPMGRVLAEALGGDLDVVLVRKIGAPYNPELALGAVDESGKLSLADHAAEMAASPWIEAEVDRQRGVIEERRQRLGRPPVDPRGRVVVVIDDGVATGATLAAALRSLRDRGARELIAAVSVATTHAVHRLAQLADRVVCLVEDPALVSISQHYGDFRQVSDDEVARALARPWLEGDLVLPEGATGVVAFAHGSGSSRASPRNRQVARALNEAGFATLLFDLLTPDEERVDLATCALRFDIDLLAERVIGAVDWLGARPETRDLSVGLFGASTGAAAALVAAAARPDAVRTIVSRGGRPDLAASALPRVRCPSLFVVGARDTQVIALNRKAIERMALPAQLEIVPGATHLFEEPGALEAVTHLATRWFDRHLGRGRSAPTEREPPSAQESPT